jgi:hypothetical protein
MNRTSCRAAVALGATAVVVLLLAGPAAAHEARQVGAYHLEVGWEHEPTYAGEQNAVQIFIHDAAGNPVDDLGNPTTLHVSAVFGPKTSEPLDLEPSWDPDTGEGTHGEWDAPIIPTAVGTYTFHLTGSIQGQVVDERFTSSDSTFDDVQAPRAIEFPDQTPTAQELAQAQSRLQPRVDTAVAQLSATRSDVSSTKTLAIVALVVALVAVAVAVFLGLRTRHGSGSA